MLKKVTPWDVKAPRFRWSRGRHIVLNPELFKNYKANVENAIEDYKLFSDIIEDFSEELKKEAVKNRDGVKLPAFMGILAVCSYKNKRRPPVKWKLSNENGVKLKEYNLHTAGLGCKIVYSVYTAKYKFRNWALWRFEGNRDFKRQVSSSFIKNYKYYKRMDNKSHVSKMFRDEYITKFKRHDDVGINIEHQGNESISECGQPNN